jgi:hypothetical protein
MVERTTVRLPEELLRRAKIRAAEEGRTLTSLIEDGLRTVLADNKPARRDRIKLPVSSAKGGMQPGMEHMSFSELQHLDDVEYFERMNRSK